MREKQAVYFMKDAVFAAADALKAGNADGAGEAALKVLLKGWFQDQSEPVALLSDGLAVPVIARSQAQFDDFTKQIAGYNGPCFTVCAVCGQNAYERGLRDYCISAAYMEARELKAAMVFDPSHAELYHAVKSLGAYMNGKSLSVSRCKRMLDAYLSLDYGTLRTANETALHDLISQAQSVRSGAAFSLELCHLASGRIDAAVGCRQSFIASAAGRLIAQEAGAAMLGFDGQPLPPMGEIGERTSFAAVCPGLQQEMSGLLAAL